MMRGLIRFLSALVNLMFGLVLLCFLPATLRQFVRALGEFMGLEMWWRFAAGIVPGLVLGLFLIRAFPWFCVFDHEATHALTGLPLGYIPIGMRVTSSGGHCRQICIAGWFAPITRHAVTLAPYFFPTFTVIAVASRSLAPASWQPWYDIGIGATFGYHVVSTVWEIYVNSDMGRRHIDHRQPAVRTDFEYSGRVFSWVFIAVMALATHGLILAVITRGYSGLTEDLRRIFVETHAFVQPWLVRIVHEIG